MRSHINVLGWLLIVLNGLSVLAGIGLFVFCSGLGAVAVASGGQDAAGIGALFGSFGLILGGIFLVIGLPGTLVGAYLLKEAPWARIGGIIISVLSLANFPLGTAIGVYGLWVLFNPETTAIFEGRATPSYR